MCWSRTGCLKLSISSKASLSGDHCKKATNDSATSQQLRNENKSLVPSVTSMDSKILNHMESCPALNLQLRKTILVILHCIQWHWEIFEVLLQGQEVWFYLDYRENENVWKLQGALTSLTVTEPGALKSSLHKLLQSHISSGQLRYHLLKKPDCNCLEFLYK